jgi:DNA-binding LacI/PurR family transcriptional regulator
MLTQWYSHLLHRGIARYAKEANWSLNASEVHALTPELTPPVASAIHHADGVIGLFGWPSAALDFIRRRRVPVVDLCQALPEIRLPRVLLDNEGLGAAVADHYLERGFRSFAFCRPAYVDDWCDAERLRGFRGALQNRGFDCHLVEVPVHTHEDPIAWLAARQCGYSCATHFRDTFIRAKGCTPSHFWKNIRRT